MRSFRVGLFVVGLVLLAVACGEGGSGSESADADTDAALAETMLFNGESIPTCESLVGEPTEDVANHFHEGGLCGRDIGLDELEAFVPGLGNQECADGTFLYWNDVGWGASGGVWNEGDGLPTDEAFDACRVE